MARERRPEDWQETIISFETPHQLRSLSIDEPESADTQDLAVQQEKFKIRLANTEDRRESASLLIEKMYTWRGYTTEGTLGKLPNRITLLSYAGEVVIGTLTLGFDSEIGLLADEMYKDEIDELRQTGHRVCEFTKLAVDQNVRSKRVLASLFHIAYIYAHRIREQTDIVIEVNPRHAVFYRRMLGFVPFGAEKHCDRVDAPAILLRLPLTFAADEIIRVGGKMEKAEHERSLYPFFFSKPDEDGITNRLLRGG